MDGPTIIGAWCIPDRIPCCLDTEISPPYPESWLSRYLVELLPKVLATMPGCEIVECSIQVDHIHNVDDHSPEILCE
jgi:hypothetical protein